ncbi:YciI family protein [Salegentibacter chungangensis]|uniref:YciI family protein n=1 Tax=Salegentibacter chungangensis TaxID=1335724 RepID=A0ABW3NN01_9FLAO
MGRLKLLKNTIGTLFLATLLTACDQPVEKTRGVPAASEVKTESHNLTGIKARAEALKKEGYKTFTYQEGDTTYLMQQYYMVFLKAGDKRNQDSTEVAELQKKHLAHLSRMAEEGYASLIGPFGDDGEIRGIVVFNTPTQEEADSLANLDPMVKAGRLKVEVHPWWTAKGGKLE